MKLIRRKLSKLVLGCSQAMISASVIASWSRQSGTWNSTQLWEAVAYLGGRKESTFWFRGLLRAVSYHFPAASYHRERIFPPKSSPVTLTASWKVLFSLVPLNSTFGAVLAPFAGSWSTNLIQKYRMPGFLFQSCKQGYKEKKTTKSNSRLHLAIGLFLAVSVSLLLSLVYSNWRVLTSYFVLPL